MVKINTYYKQRESIFLVLKECDSGKCFTNSTHFLTDRHGPQFYFTDRDSAGTFFSGGGGGGGRLVTFLSEEITQCLHV